MSRMPADPVGRLAVLEAARAEVEPGLILNFAEMAKVAGLTDRGLKLIVDADEAFPIKQRGDMGVPWQLDAAEVLDHLIGQARAAKVEREARTARVTRLAGLGAAVGVSSPSDRNGNGSGAASEGMTVQDLGKLVQVNRDFQRAKIEQGSLVSASKAEQAAIDYNNVVQSAILDSAQRADPAGIWPPEIRAAWENETRNMLVAIQDASNKWLEKIRSRGSGD